MKKPTGRIKPQISTKEVEVLQLLADGKGRIEINEILGISDSTTGKHLSHIREKFGTESLIAAVLDAIRWGILPLPEIYPEAGIPTQTHPAVMPTTLFN